MFREVIMETKLTKAPKWTNEIRSKLRATDGRVYEPEIARGSRKMEDSSPSAITEQRQ
jgi:hypothetical protein